LAGLIGGLIASKDREYYYGSLAGALGILIGVTIYLNFTLVTSYQVWEQFLQLLIGISDLSFLALLFPLIVLVLLGTISGYTGALMLPIIMEIIEKNP
jgi:hypothetical protein